MVLNLKGFLNGGDRTINIDTFLDFTKEEYGGVTLFAKPTKVVGKVVNKADVTELSLMCDVTLNKPCDRCGKETVKELQIPIKRIIVSELSDDDNVELLLIENDTLDLYEVCFSEILLALPMKHLCDDDCKGICSNCGKNLNDGPCGCETKSVDPRLEALLQLLEDED